MKYEKSFKIILITTTIIILYFVIDLLFVFNLNRPLFAIKAKTPHTYTGLFYNVYNCPEYSVAQIKSKGSKFTCAIDTVDIGEVIEIVDTSKEIKDFACAEALEQFYEDEDHEYYYSCMKGSFIIVKYENGYQETVEAALKNKTITISDLDKYNIHYIKYDK